MRRYLKLRGRMSEMDVEGKDLARVLKLSAVSVSKRMTGSVSWSLDEAYAVMDFLVLPHDRLSEYFPAGGRETA